MLAIFCLICPKFVSTHHIIFTVAKPLFLRETKKYQGAA